LAPNSIGWLGVVPDNRLTGLTLELGQEVFGLEERHIDSEVPTRVWRPAPSTGFQAADQWGFVASHASRAGDEEYAQLAASISTALRAVGFQFRNVSDCYHAQLLGALKRKTEPGREFANIHLSELHIACHGLTAEMGSARDYIASLAARRVGAPARIEALNRLAEWAVKPANSVAASDSLVSTLVAAFDANGPDPWLWELGEYRNTFLHRLPLGLSESARRLTVCEHVTRHGPAHTLRMAIEAPIGSGRLDDALSRFVKLGARLERLAQYAVGFARYPAELPLVIVSQSPPPTENASGQ
jgi:hypothetical protein